VLIPCCDGFGKTWAVSPVCASLCRLVPDKLVRCLGADGPVPNKSLRGNRVCRLRPG
jgi:hypothetical protein